MSETFISREKFEIPAAISNESLTWLQNVPEIEQEKRMEVEVSEERDSTLEIQELTGENIEISEVSEETEKVSEEEFNQDIEVPEKNKDSLKNTSILDDDDYLISGSSFTSCCSFKYIRHSILSRKERDASTFSLDSGIDIESLENPCQNRVRYHSQDQLEEKPSCGEDTDDNSSTVKIVMEKRTLHFTPENSVCDYEISIDEVYERFSTWFSRAEIDLSFSSFMQVDEDLDGYICLAELKRFLEKIDIPQTHLAAKNLMTHVVDDHEGRLNFCQALIIHATLLNRLELRKWRLQNQERERLAKSDAVDVSQVGVSGAKQFFEAKIAMQTDCFALTSDPPLVKVQVNNAPTCQIPVSKRGQYGTAAALFKQLESEK
ncbi:uncharacterized protein LOC108116158 [Drosophila eugracilis]|uniref:uncharacterized protein LOC108116158 n=1 Tax=Drosophila eugracilis TaxID=29029 RepID=UPI0007E86FB2|nr:uncharacterized protein LOC108116158 [Drosophila eugracilis]